MRARKLALRGLSPDLTGGLRFEPEALADARPFALSPPVGDLPSLRCHAGELASYFPLLFFCEAINAFWSAKY